MKKSIPEKQLREFGLLIGIGFPIIVGWIIPEIRGYAFRAWTLWLSIPALITGITKPNLLRYPYKGWMALGHALGWFNSHVILGLVFIVVLQPIALVMRIVGHDPLRRRQKGGKSYRENRQGHKTDLNRIF